MTPEGGREVEGRLGDLRRIWEIYGMFQRIRGGLQAFKGFQEDSCGLQGFQLSV